MASTILVLNHDRQINVATKKKRELLRVLVNYFLGGLGGAVKITSFDLFPNGAAPVSSAGTITVVGADGGAYTAVINGFSVAATGTGVDATTAAAIAAAINASTNALVQFFVTATSALGVVTITASQKSIYGNAITLAATGTGATASAARLASGAGGNVSVNSNTL